MGTAAVKAIALSAAYRANQSHVYSRTRVIDCARVDDEGSAL